MLNLSKGETLNLTKADGAKLEKACVGVNWGSMADGTSVDLDASIVILDSNKKAIETVFYNNKTSKDASIKHSGDDLTGDTGGDDGLDNEVITIDLSKVEATYLVVVLNSFKKQAFDTIPYIGCRVYEGTPTQVKEVLGTFKLDNNPEFNGKVSAILGIFTKVDGVWSFKAVGKPTVDKDLGEITNNASTHVN